VNKKKQKNFISLTRTGFTAAGQVSQKFCAAFFKKRLLTVSLPSIASGGLTLPFALMF
jgi:hypothetical protein